MVAIRHSSAAALGPVYLPKEAAEKIEDPAQKANLKGLMAGGLPTTPRSKML
jgi:hypothetical protein